MPILKSEYPFCNSVFLITSCYWNYLGREDLYKIQKIGIKKYEDMIVNKLEIFILTYNRESKLERTLQMLSNSSLKDLKITIMNNASTDGTLSVYEKYKEKFPALLIITNPYNIGASANYLRALENSTSIYTWILCDDDILTSLLCRNY